MEFDERFLPPLIQDEELPQIYEGTDRPSRHFHQVGVPAVIPGMFPLEGTCGVRKCVHARRRWSVQKKHSVTQSLKRFSRRDHPPHERPRPKE